MVKKILGTILSRGILAVLNFLLAVLTARYLGPEGKGDVSLFMLNLSIVQLVNNFVGGPYLVYLVPRKNAMHLLAPSYGWALMTSVIVPAVLCLLDLLSAGLLPHLMVISLLFSITSVNSLMMVGKEEMSKYNLTSLLQAFVLAGCFILVVKVNEQKDLAAYLNALYISTAFALAISTLLITRHFGKITFTGIGPVFSETIKNGFVVQLGNIAQMLNYRLSFYLLDRFHEDGRKEVGVYSVAVSVAEALWLISQSVALVLYSRISNTGDKVYSQKLTLALLKIVFLCTGLGAAILLCLPSALYVWIFGEGFEAVQSVMLPLSAGVVLLSAGIILSSYFVGHGNTKIPVISSSIGLAATLLIGFYLIPKYGMTGAAITASLSYTSSVIYQLVCFFREAKNLSFHDLFFSGTDIRMISTELRTILSGKQIQK